jgi:hypothetical protein
VWHATGKVAFQRHRSEQRIDFCLSMMWGRDKNGRHMMVGLGRMSHQGHHTHFKAT